MNVVLDALANGFSSTLVHELRTQRGLVYGVEGALVGNRNVGEWFIATSAAGEHASQIVDTIVGELHRVHRYGLNPDTFTGAARAAALSFAYGREAITELLEVEAENWMLGLEPGAAWKTPSRLWSLEPTTWASAVQPWLDPAAAVVVVAGGQDVVLANPPDQTAALESP
jgi:predicted Zn-dependent peptidase